MIPKKFIDNYDMVLTGMLIGVSAVWVLKSRILSSFSLIRNVATHVRQGNIGTKLVLVVRTDLGMSRGKVASQCAHAAVSCYKKALQESPETLKMWEIMGQPKIVVKPDEDGEQCILKLHERAKTLGLVSAVVRDAGKTQIECGTVTVVGVGPGHTHLVDQVTKHLKLL